MNRPQKTERRVVGLSGIIASSSDDSNERAVAQYVPLRIDESERILAQVMNSLPTAERAKIIEEVHGVSKPMDETPEFVAQKLAALASEIQKRKTKVYETALKQNPNYVEDSDFRLMFLRCEGFVPSAASKRMMKYLKLKQSYFGEGRITKDITIADLSEDDIRSLESGAIQVLSEKDRSGRAVVVVFPGMREQEGSPENMMRASFLLEMSLLQDPDVQKRGVVYIYHDTKPKSEGLGAPDATMVSVAKNHKASMPLHYAAYHVCLRDRSGYHSIGHAVCKEEDIVKGISHYGNDKECRLKLQGFGIPVLCFPISEDGIMNFEAHREWVQKQKDNAVETSTEKSRRRTRSKIIATSSTSKPQEVQSDDSADSATDGDSQPSSDAVTRAMEMAPGSVLQPAAIDVVLGRGRWFQYFPGNVSFREFLEARDTEYNEANRTEKVTMTKSIVNELKASGRRFLKLEQNKSGDNMWTEVDDKEIYKKVSQCYRTVRKKEKA